MYGGYILIYLDLDGVSTCFSQVIGRHGMGPTFLMTKVALVITNDWTVFFTERTSGFTIKHWGFPMVNPHGKSTVSCFAMKNAGIHPSNAI